MMVIKTKRKSKMRERSNTLTIAKVQRVQVPDADMRLERVFKILISTFENMENKAK